MQKFTLFTWPDSQEFVSNPLCHLVCPPADYCGPTHLNLSYMVPVEVAEPVGAEKVYVKLDAAESAAWAGRENARDTLVLFDYDGHAFVEESLLRACLPAPVPAMYDVCIAPMTCVKAIVKDPLHPTEEEMDEVIRNAADAMLTSGDTYLSPENVESVTLYEPGSDRKTVIFESPASIDSRLKAIMSLKDRIGEFSVDLYYNDVDKENPYTAKLHSVLDKGLSYHARAKSFHVALDMLMDYLREHYEI